METQSKRHPSALHLAALALDKLKPEAAAEVRAHLGECDECRRYVTDTPRSELAELVRNARAAAAEKNTPSAGLSGTVKWRQSGDVPSPVPAQYSSPSPPGRVEHAVGQHEIPHDLYVQTKYRILRLLGRGGMGSVYEAVHVRMQRKVAIKTINPELVHHPQVLLRFEEELKAIASLDHPNIARAFDAESFGSVHAIILEFLEGQTLADLVRARGRLGVVDATRSVRQALLGLQSAHQKGFVHRDMKPQNLLVTRDSGQVKILDFGLAKAVSENRLARGLTSSRATIGTYAYMAPEQALDAAKADIRADIYSLGCTLYYLLSGKLPFAHESDAQLLLAHQNETSQPLYRVQPDVPRALSDVVARMLAKDPADRPQTPREAADLLLPFTQGKKFPAAPENPQRASARRAPSLLRWKWAGMAAAVLALLAFGGWAAGVFWVRTAQGTIVIDGVPEGADVTVDGQRVTMTRNGDSVAITAVETGPHHLKLVHDGRELWSDDVTIKMAGQLVRARFNAETKPATTAQRDRVGTGADSERKPDNSGQPAPSDKSASPLSRATDAPAIPRTVRSMKGNWRIEGDELVCEPGGRAETITFGDPTWTDIDFTYQCRRSNHVAAMASHVRNDGQGNFVAFCMGKYGGKNNWCEFYCTRKGEKWARKNRRGRGIELAADTWFQVRVTCRGPELVAFVDGQEIARVKRDDFPKGCIAFSAHKNGTVRFRDVKVTAPDGTELWQGLPDLTTAVPSSSSLEPDESLDLEGAPESPDTPAADDTTSDSSTPLPPSAARDTTADVNSPSGETAPQPPTVADANLAESAEPKSASKGPQGIDLLNLLNIRRDTARGNWRRKGDSLVSAGTGLNMIRIPYQPPPEYRLQIKAERIAGRNDLQIGLVTGRSNCVVVLDGWAGTISGISWLDGKVANANETTHRGTVFPDSGSVTIVITVRPKHITVTAEDKVIVDWTGNEARLSLKDRLNETPNSLFLAVQKGGSYRIDEAFLTPLDDAEDK